MDNPESTPTPSPVSPAPQGAKGYGKRPMWRWVLIYLVVAAVLYGAVYYFAFAKKGGYSTNSANTSTTSY